MVIKQLKISNYRAIKRLTLYPNSGFNCLIGNGDSGKTTVLTALSLLFSRTWQANFFDTDFHNGTTKERIEIAAVITDFPEEFLSEQKLGLHTCGWDAIEKKKLDEPLESSSVALEIRLRITASLEPEWEAVGPNEATKRISHTDRAKLGLLLIQSERRNDFTWSRGSLVTSASSTTASLEEELCRLNRQILSEAELDLGSEIETLLEGLGTEIGKIGVGTDGKLKARLLPRSLSAHNGNIAIFDEACPLEQKGTGTRKLAHFSLQSSMGKNISVLLIDEFEHGLEPHRIRQLLNYCRRGADSSTRQVFITTHSAEVLRWLSTDEIQIIRETGAKHTTIELEKNHRELVRDVPSALLAKRSVICEGVTELGLCIGIEPHWEGKFRNRSAASFGVAFVDGLGAPSSGQIALKLRDLGFDVALFCDSDRYAQGKNNHEEELLKRGGSVFQWEAPNATETQVFNDVPHAIAVDLYRLAKRRYSKGNIRAQVADVLGIKEAEFDDENLSAPGKSPDQVKEAIGLTAAKKAWFKREAIGMELGEVLVEHLKKGSEDNVTKTLNSLGKWIYG